MAIRAAFSLLSPSLRRASYSSSSLIDGPCSFSGMEPPFWNVLPLTPGFMQLRVDAAGDLRRHAWDSLELLGARRDHRLDRAEMVQEGSPPSRADALPLVE